MADGYCRFPAIHGARIVFVCEDDLWTVWTDGGPARRLTSGVGEAGAPALSPDGRWLAFVGREEGAPEIYVMEADGGQPRRLTFLGASLLRTAGWSRDGRDVLFATNARQPFASMIRLFAAPRAGGDARELPYGVARYVSFGQRGVAIGRHGADPARWKRYRGGLAGQIWVDARESGAFRRILADLPGNLSHPMWIGERIYFHSDHEGVGNLYSCAADGRDLRRHTRHADHYLRNPSTDGRRIVYHAGADLFLFDPRENRARPIPLVLRGPRTQRNRKFVDPGRHLEDYDPHPRGAALALTARGKVFTMGNWEGAAVQHGVPDGARYRLARWLADGKRVVAVTDEGGEERLVVFTVDGSRPPRRLRNLPIGRAVEMAASPARDEVLLTNHRFELLWVDLKRGRARRIDRSRHERIAGIAWSPDGRWAAYGIMASPHQCVLRIAEARRGPGRDVTRAVLRDVSPAFDPEGKYLYFLSYREFDPVYDQMHFELGFPRGMRPYLVTLRKDLRSPFAPEFKWPEADGKKPAGGKKRKPDAPAPVAIDFAGITERVAAFPVPEGRYEQILGIHGGALFTVAPVEGALGTSWDDDDRAPRATLQMYKFEEARCETLAEGVSDAALSADAKTLVYRAGERLRAMKAGEKPDEKTEGEPPGRRSGWIDLSRARLAVTPEAEWRQMYGEAWRLMRDHFWTADMSGVDWSAVRRRYAPLVARVATRSEFSDLIWEMQGELGTSHCYELGGDYRPAPRYDVGHLGADLVYDARHRGYRIARIVRGDPWNPSASSPLVAPGVNVREGDVIVAVNGRRLDARLTPAECLVNQAGQEVTLALAGGRVVTVRAARSETPARYREWVERNRLWVHRASRGRAGYIHIPDMGPAGFSEFHRQYLAEVDREGLLVDVRYNGGGHVSPLLLEKLARKRIGYDVPRWGEPIPYPADSPAGPLVALTNEQAGSDGDIFSHCFKLYKLGPLVGARTWGGVVGIWPRHALADGSVTTQPEFSFWFVDVGFGVENRGTEPDVPVTITPQEDAAGRDPQLARGLAVLMDLLRRHPPLRPRFAPRPRNPLPRGV